MSPASPTPFTRTPRPPAQLPATRAVRTCVASWHGRSLHVQHEHDLLLAYKLLKTNEASLYTHTPHAPRLLTNLSVELTKRGLLPC